MTEAEAIKYATLHLEGEAHEWRYHGQVKLGHANITSYVDFTQSLMNRFDRDPEIHFRELAQLRQTGLPEAYITNFQRMVVMVTDISQQRLVMLFTKDLIEPLRGWVKAFRPTTLYEVIMRSQDMKDAVTKKVPTKSFIPQGGKEMKFPHKSWTGKDRMNEETRRELRREKRCFSCKELWEPGHRCMGKGKVHYIDVVFDEEDDYDDEGIGQDSGEPLLLELEK
jgi:hypothetical protein